MPANLVNIRELGIDISDQYVGINDISLISSYMTVDSTYFDDTGTPWTWGNNSQGQLGLGDRTNRSSPVQIGSGNSWRLVRGGSYHAFAIANDGSLWTWGKNASGQLGLNDSVSRSSPVQVGSLNDWRYVAPGDGFTTAVKTDGTLWSWGVNSYGTIGTGVPGDGTASSPIQVGALRNWKNIISGFAYSVALKTDGTLWSWGYNYGGYLGLNDRVWRSSPTQIGSLTNWKQLCNKSFTSMAAIKTDGTLWVWGDNAQGQLGLNDRTNRSSPAQVGALTNWKEVSIGGTATCAVKTDGTLWSWGNDNNGSLGNNNYTSRSSPAQVGALTNWKNVIVNASNSVLAIKTDGTLWAWGAGIGGSPSSGSPVQVGTLNTWKSFSATNQSVIALK